MPAKTEEAKEMDRFYAGAEEDVDARLERPRPCARCTSMTRRDKADEFRFKLKT